MQQRFYNFWQRITDGIAIHDLWAQFQADARSSYRFYSSEVDSTPRGGESGWKRFWRVARGLFWAMIMKLSPGRRVVLLLALVLLLFPSFRVGRGNGEIDTTGNTGFVAGLLLVGLLALELSDRVTMKRDLEIAREIQSWLMPSQAPHVPGVDIAFATRPANTVAGDYYDAFFRPKERLLLVVADVAGKSIPAALLTATLQACLRTLAALPGSLVELVGRVNRYSCEQSLNGRRFTTAFLAELQPESGHLTYVNAGHNWPVLRRANGGVERLEAGGLPLGINAALPYQCGEILLARGDLLLMFTDGLVEAEDSRGSEYGEERMLSEIDGFRGANAAEALKQLMSSVDRFVGMTRQHDDITCLVLRMM
ncbi:MAG TPA: PP2C family protein-serine/threonine phosphatase [Verrucomicrobiae bacterium]|nr:PP2C family protein-serine/threonine phosphatase [Verrucomicrobiae bacterium]